MICAFNFGVDEKQAAEMITKGVVGHTGRNTPMAPRASDTNPMAANAVRFHFMLYPN
jgi:hypothetical protein